MRDMKRLKELREAKGISRERLAYEAGLSTNSIRRIEAGADVRLSSIVRIAEALGVSIADLLEDAA